MKKNIIIIFVFVMIQQMAWAQSPEYIPLYKNIPGQKKSDNYKEETILRKNGTYWTSKVTEPNLRYYAPSGGEKTGAAVVICPGGGYGGLAISHEGYDVAEKFASIGVSAFVLKYRLPSDEIMEDRKIGPLQDAQQAIKYVRENASKYGVNPDKIGIIGFSAGGHLASTASTHFERVVIENKKGTSVRPDFSILIYPVITFGDFTHKGSRKNLIGENVSQDLIDLYSNEKQVTAKTPITFMVHANDDKTVPVENTFNYILALNKSGVKNEAHIYPSGGHGFGLNNKTVKDYWFDRLVNWMDSQGILK
ncbi:alpha/beta hydrolase [Pseudopedobacter beijingensis]|uniref:Alpha/beta hydrolase n=1 Tax=Pseudopedobacter beijingensis TaxID=1207056 RepID=A0ABW4IA01_9SPHI